VPEDKRQALEAYFKEYEAECRRKMASCFGKTRQGVVEKEKFVMPTIPSKVSSDVSTSSSDLLGQLSSIMDQKIAESQKFTNDLLVNLTDHVHTFIEGK
jgi:hypothetical protein